MYELPPLIIVFTRLMIAALIAATRDPAERARMRDARDTLPGFGSDLP